MLKEIVCSFFRQSKISFHEGLNVVLGDDDAKNSIGKSTALMVIDFSFGGDSLTDDKAGVIKALGHHHYDFAFQFAGVMYHFSRSTDQSSLVFRCDKNYARQGEQSIKEFREWLKSSYGLEGSEGSFRSLVSPFSRIWGKGELEPDHPFDGDVQESMGAAVGRLIDLFERSDEISAEKKTLEKQRDRRKLVSDSMKAELIPRVNKTRYKENVGAIADGVVQIERLKQGFGGALSVYETLFDENLKKIQLRKNELGVLRTDLQNKIRRLQKEISGITPRLSANIALVREFFPGVNVERIERVEAFHHQIGGIVKRELKEELISAVDREKTVGKELSALDDEVQIALRNRGVPDDLFQKFLDLKEKTDRAALENGYFDHKAQLDAEIKSSNQRLDSIYENIFLSIEGGINSKLAAFNRVVYGPRRNSSELRLKGPSSYSFISPDDTGTGKTYAGLVGFDVAMLSLTKLPFFIHDSIIYKNIEVPATIRVLRILASVKRRQIFLSFDEAKKYGAMIERLLAKFMVIRLSHNNLLYTKDWRGKE